MLNLPFPVALRIGRAGIGILLKSPPILDDQNPGQALVWGNQKPTEAHRGQPDIRFIKSWDSRV